MTDDAAPAPQPAAGLRAVRDKNPYAGFGRAVSYLMTKPAFAERKFGQWSRTLAGQVNRNHYFLVIDEKSTAVGFAGWALANEANAKAWVNGGGDLASEQCVNGDCMVINAWAADTDEINRYILRELRKSAVGLKAAYFKRFYPDGRVRPMELPITGALSNHVAKSR